MDPTTAWEHPGFASTTPAALAAVVPADGSLRSLVLSDAATGNTIVRAYGVGGTVTFQDSAGAAIGFSWASVSKAGSSLADLATRSAADLASGNLAYALLPTGSGSWDVGLGNTLTLTRAVTMASSLAVTGQLTMGALGHINLPDVNTTIRGIGYNLLQAGDTAGLAKIANGGMTVSQAGAATLNSKLQFVGDLAFGGSNTASISRNSTHGLVLQGYGGATNAWAIFNNAGTLVMRNPVGTTNVVFDGTTTHSGGGLHSRFPDTAAAHATGTIVFNLSTVFAIGNFGDAILATCVDKGGNAVGGYCIIVGYGNDYQIVAQGGSQLTFSISGTGLMVTQTSGATRTITGAASWVVRSRA